MRALLAAAVLFCLVPSGARAEEALRLTMDKTEVLHLDRDAASIVVNNPAHATVAMDNPRLLVVTPHEAGATSLIVLDGSGGVILQRDIIVSNVKSKYMRVRRACGANDAGCAAAAYAYCPDGCYEVTPVPAPASGGSGAAVPLPADAPRPTIDGEPLETLIGAEDSCPPGTTKIPAPAGADGYTCTQ